jgi:hypothetical protein
MDEHAQLARDAAEWRRWEETGLPRWDAARRADWARSLFAQQQGRAQGRAEKRAEQLRDAMRSEEEARRDAARRERWGDAPGRGGSMAARDPLGHYRRLGLGDRAGIASEDEIKAAYRRTAHLLHPDKQQGSSQAEQALAAASFRELQASYEVLKDARLREHYDGS